MNLTQPNIAMPQMFLPVAFFLVVLSGCASRDVSIIGPALKKDISYHGIFRTQAARIGPIYYLSVYSFLPGDKSPEEPVLFKYECSGHDLKLLAPQSSTQDPAAIRDVVCKTIRESEALLGIKIPISSYTIRTVNPEVRLEQDVRGIWLKPKFGIAFHFGEDYEADAREAARILSHELLHIVSRYETRKQLDGNADYQAEEFKATLFAKCVEYAVFGSIGFDDLSKRTYDADAQNLKASLSAEVVVRRRLRDHGIQLSGRMLPGSASSDDFNRLCQGIRFVDHH